MEHQTDNTQHIERANNDDSFEIFKPKILTAIDKINGKRKRADIDAIQNFIVQSNATNIDKNTIKDFIVQSNTTNIDKNTIKDFVTELVAQKLLIKKNTSQANESYHKTPTEVDLPQSPRHSIRTPTKKNFNKTSEVETRTLTNFIHSNIYIKNDVFEVFYEDYLEYKGYANEILNT